MEDSEYVVIGKIGSTYGIKGWVKVQSFTQPITNISSYGTWYLENQNTWVPIKVEECRQHAKSMIAKLAGQQTPEEARKLAGKKISIKRTELPTLQKDEYYWRDLIGLEVINQNNKSLGNVIYLMETGSNDVIVVKGEKEIAIPFLRDSVIQKVDLTARVINVNWDE